MSYKVIARKYRPQTFADLVGQQHVTRTLANAIQSNRVAHAYIFSGVRGVGKTTTARILAKALNCVKGPTIEPDNTCDACREIAAGTSLDVIEIDAASNRGIDQIRELREMVRYAPAASRYKVVILDEAHQLTDEASNALLKTLEEPPERVVFILATTRPEDLVETIKSRAQLFQFRALTFQEIAGEIERVAKAENLTIDSGAVAVLARAAEGSLRDGLSLLEQAIAYGGDAISDTQVRELLGVVAESVLDELVGRIAAQSAERALGLVHRLIADGQNLQHFCREAIRHFRNLLVARVCGADSNLIAAPEEERPRLAEQAAQFGEEDLTRFFQYSAGDRRRPAAKARSAAAPGAGVAEADQRAAACATRGDCGRSCEAAKRLRPERRTSGNAGATATARPRNVRDRRATQTAAIASPFSASAASAGGDRGTDGAGAESVSGLQQQMRRRSLNRATAAIVYLGSCTEVPRISASPANAACARRGCIDQRAATPLPATAATDRGARRGRSAERIWTRRKWKRSKRRCKDKNFCGRWWSTRRDGKSKAGSCGFFFRRESRALAEMLQARDPMERLRTVLNQVVGAAAARVC